MKKLVLAASIASMLSGAAFAATNLDAGTGTGGTYASEIVISGATVLNDGAAADQTATVVFGASLATDFVAYVRFDLSSGTFSGAPTFAVNDSAGAATVNIAQGGVGFGYVIFAIAPAAGENLVNGNTGTFVGNGVSVSNQDTVTLEYNLYETLTNAANENLPLKTTAAASFLSFSNAIAITAGSTQTQTADVAATGGAYKTFVNASSEEPVLSFTVTHTSRALLTGAASVVGDILAATNSVSVTGDFTARGAVTLDTDSNCGNAGTASSSVSNTAAGFTGIAAATIASGAPLYACYSVSGGTAIPVSTYTGSIDLVGQAGFSPTDGATGTGNIERNGTVLKAAFAEASTVNGTASAISLTNTSAIDADFTVRCLAGSTPVVGTPGTVAANTSGRYPIVNTLGCPAGVRGIELTFAVPVGSVIGSVVRQNITTGVASFDGMVGNQ